RAADWDARRPGAQRRHRRAVVRVDEGRQALRRTPRARAAPRDRATAPAGRLRPDRCRGTRRASSGDRPLDRRLRLLPPGRRARHGGHEGHENAPLPPKQKALYRAVRPAYPRNMPDDTDDARYRAAVHAMQTGVAIKMNYDPAETQPKHLRVGINSAMCDHAAVVPRLRDKGIITDAEYRTAIADEMERERDR